MTKKPELDLYTYAYRGERDIPALAGLFAAVARVDGPELDRSESQIRQILSSPRAMPEENAFLFAVDGQLVGYGRTFLEDGPDESLFRLMGHVHPEWRRRGIGRRVMERLEQRIGERLDEPANQVVRILVGASLEHKDRLTLFGRMGYQMERYFFEMERPLHREGRTVEVPAADLPVGFVVRSLAERPDLGAAMRVCNEAFRDHWGHTETALEDWQYFASDPGHRPDLWLVAWDEGTGEPAAVCLNGIIPDHNTRVGRLEGWVHTLAVRRPYRKQGLGRALLLESMRLMQQAGMDWAMLGVDMENLTGALRLYQGAGFQAVRRSAALSKKVRESHT